MSPLEFQLKCLANEIEMTEKALRGQGSYGKVAMDTATDEEKDMLREGLMDSKKEKRQLEQQLQQLQQPHQESNLFEPGSGVKACLLGLAHSHRPSSVRNMDETRVEYPLLQHVSAQAKLLSHLLLFARAVA